MKILHIASIGRIYEGIGTVINHLYQEQINLGHDVRIISKRQNLLYTNLPISTITSTRDFESFISEWIPDIVIFHSHFHVEFVRFSKILSIKHIPYCVQLHGALSKENYRKGFLKKFFGGKIFFNSVLKNASSIIYLNESEYNNSVVPYINPKRCIIPNGCEDSDNAVITPNKRDNINLTFIGRINYYHKGLDVLINALKIIDTIDNPKFHINFYGNENARYIESEDCITISELTEKFIKAEISFDKALDIVKKKKIIYAPDATMQAMLSDKKGRVLIIEPGIGYRYEQENFSLITNYSILKPDITKPYIVSGDTRYEVAKELLAGYDKDFSVNDAFKVLKSVSQKDLWATRVSFVYSTEKNKVYYVLNNDFSNVFEFQF